jgi:biopolymer transport protein ExbD
LARELNGQEGVVSLHVDKNVTTEHLIYVAGIATSLKARVSVVAKPN